MNLINVILGVFAALFQFIAAYFGYRIYKFNRLSKWWLALIFAFLIQGVRRVFTVFDDMGSPLIPTSAVFDRTLMFVISLLILVGLWAMMRNFERFDIVASKVREKIKNKRQK